MRWKVKRAINVDNGLTDTLLENAGRNSRPILPFCASPERPRTENTGEETIAVEPVSAPEERQSTAMTTQTQEAVEHHLARLETADCRSLVADLWAARGFATREDGPVVVATRGGVETVIYAVGRHRFGSLPAPDRPVDTVVAVSEERDATAAVGESARLLDATDLRKMLFYAIDRETTAALCERHLGARPNQLRPPLGARMRRRARAVTPRTQVVLAAALVALALASLGAGTFVLTESAGTDASPDAATSAPAQIVTVTTTSERDEVNAVPASEGAPGGVTNESLLPPGVNETGITNLSALAAAHERAVGTQSYTLWLDLYRSEAGVPNGERLQRDMDIAVAGERYLLRTELENESGHRRPVQTVYHDGTSWYLADHANRSTSYRQLSTKPSMVAPDPSRLRRALVVDYLSAVETTVTEVDQNGAVRYQIFGEGQSSAWRSRTVSNYTVTATVTSEGLVRRLTVSADIRTRTGSYDARMEVAYDRFGETTVEAPEWVSREFDGDPATEAGATDE